MTPYEIELIFHFHCCHGLPEKPPIYEMTVHSFLHFGLIEPALTVDGQPSFKTTAAGADYVRRLISVPVVAEVSTTTNPDMQQQFEAWYPPPGIPISREAAWLAYQKGQRDLLEAMGDPVAHIFPSTLKKFEFGEHVDEAYSIEMGRPGERSVPVYRLQEDTPK